MDDELRNWHCYSCHRIGPRKEWHGVCRCIFCNTLGHGTLTDEPLDTHDWSEEPVAQPFTLRLFGSRKVARR